MFIIDTTAYNNRLRTTHPFEKFFFSMISILIALASSHYYVHLLIILVMSAAILAIARINFSVFMKLFSIPLVFILFSISAVMLVMDTKRFEAYVIVDIAGYFIGIIPASFHQGIALLTGSVSATICLYFFILTTPLADIEFILIKLRTPGILREMIIHVYRFIFILYGMAGNIYTSQKSRRGYTGIKRAFHSLSALASSVLIKSLSFGECSYHALIGRGYTGELHVMRNNYTVSVKNWIIMVLIEALLIGLEIGLTKWA